jgi:hypothetical protein
MTDLIHAYMIKSLERHFFTQSCEIQTPSSEVDDYGQPKAEDDDTEWTTVAKMKSIPCRVAPASGGLRRNTRTTATNETHVIVLAGQYQVSTKMRAVVNGIRYRVLAPSYDAEGVMTRLSVELVTP